MRKCSSKDPNTHTSSLRGTRLSFFPKPKVKTNGLGSVMATFIILGNKARRSNEWAKCADAVSALCIDESDLQAFIWHIIA